VGRRDPQASLPEIDSHNVLTHEWLAEIPIHDHVSYQNRTVDGDARGGVVAETLFLLRRIETEHLCVVSRNQRDTARTRIEY
jgi:hypothetical protein